MSEPRASTSIKVNPTVYKEFKKICHALDLNIQDVVEDDMKKFIEQAKHNTKLTWFWNLNEQTNINITANQINIADKQKIISPIPRDAVRQFDEWSDSELLFRYKHVKMGPMEQGAIEATLRNRGLIN